MRIVHGLLRQTDFNRQLTRVFFSASHYWLEVYHVDGFRYDCLPNFWDGPFGGRLRQLVYNTYQLTKQKIAANKPYWNRFDGGARRCVSYNAPSNWKRPKRYCIVLLQYHKQNKTYDAAKAVARGDRGLIYDWACRLDFSVIPSRKPPTVRQFPKPVCNTSKITTTHASSATSASAIPTRPAIHLFQEGDRSRWYKLQPYLIATIMSKGIPMLWQGEEFAENYFLPDFGSSRVALLRPLRGTFFTTIPASALCNFYESSAAFGMIVRTFVTAPISFSITGTVISNTVSYCRAL